MTTSTWKHTCTIDNAPLFAKWCQGRGGVAVWRSINLSNPSASWSTPALTDEPDPKPYSKPTWQAANEPEMVVTDPAEIGVLVPREVKRFRVTLVQRGMALKCSDGASRKIRAAVDKAGESAWYEFDYFTQEAVIFVPDSEISLAAWIAQQPSPAPPPAAQVSA